MFKHKHCEWQQQIALKFEVKLSMKQVETNEKSWTVGFCGNNG